MPKEKQNEDPFDTLPLLIKIERVNKHDRCTKVCPGDCPKKSYTIFDTKPRRKKPTAIVLAQSELPAAASTLTIDKIKDEPPTQTSLGKGDEDSHLSRHIDRTEVQEPVLEDSKFFPAKESVSSPSEAYLSCPSRDLVATKAKDSVLKHPEIHSGTEFFSEPSETCISCQCPSYASDLSIELSVAIENIESSGSSLSSRSPSREKSSVHSVHSRQDSKLHFARHSPSKISASKINSQRDLLIPGDQDSLLKRYRSVLSQEDLKTPAKSLSHTDSKASKTSAVIIESVDDQPKPEKRKCLLLRKILSKFQKKKKIKKEEKEEAEIIEMLQ